MKQRSCISIDHERAARKKEKKCWWRCHYQWKRYKQCNKETLKPMIHIRMNSELLQTSGFYMQNQNRMVCSTHGWYIVPTDTIGELRVTTHKCVQFLMRVARQRGEPNGLAGQWKSWLLRWLTQHSFKLTLLLCQWWAFPCMELYPRFVLWMRTTQANKYLSDVRIRRLKQHLPTPFHIRRMKVHQFTWYLTHCS